MRRNVVKWLKDLDAYPVENPAYPGTPDVNFLNGWLELKHLPNWPVRANTPVQLGHFTPRQRIWLRKRWRAGGGAWLLLQVGSDWLLFDGDIAAQFVGKGPTQAELKGIASHYTSGMTKGLLTTWLPRRTPSD